MCAWPAVTSGGPVTGNEPLLPPPPQKHAQPWTRDGCRLLARRAREAEVFVPELSGFADRLHFCIDAGGLGCPDGMRPFFFFFTLVTGPGGSLSL